MTCIISEPQIQREREREREKEREREREREIGSFIIIISGPATIPEEGENFPSLHLVMTHWI